MKNLVLGLALFTLFCVGAIVTSQQAFAGGHDSGGTEGAPEYIQLTPLILPIVDEVGVSQTVNLVIALEVTKPESAAKINSIKPRLIDAYIQEMYGVLSKHAALDGGVIKVGYIKEKLNKVSEDVLGHNVIDGVLLQVVQQRPI